MLWGMDPRHYLVAWKDEREDRRSHKDLEQQSQADAQVWGKLLKMYPDIIERTINYLDDRITQTSSGEKKELQEWKRILGSISFQQLKKLLQSDSERAVSDDSDSDSEKRALQELSTAHIEVQKEIEQRLFEEQGLAVTLLSIALSTTRGALIAKSEGHILSSGNLPELVNVPLDL